MKHEMQKKFSENQLKVPSGLQQWAKKRDLKIIDVAQTRRMTTVFKTKLNKS